MTAYPALTDIEIQWRAAGSVACVLVEGETELDDAWYYRAWFGDRSREVAFFPQDGWEKVVVAVADLRASLDSRCIYGIVDRDFEEVPSFPPMPGDGILRTRKYTLENYLLDPECWYRYVRPHTRRVPREGWNSLEEVRATIDGLYRECLPLSAFNWTLRRARNLDRVAFEGLSTADKEYLEHPQALAGLGDASPYLRALQARLGIGHDLGQMYIDRLAALSDLPLAGLEEVVSGKYVIKILRHRFPLGRLSRQRWEDVLSAYVDGCPEPHPDLVQLVDQIAQAART